MKRLALSGLLILAAMGCGKDSTDQTAQNPAPAPAAAAAGTSTTPNAQTAVVTNGASTEPGEIVALFLDSLRRGDEKAANGVLTTLAQESLAKTDYAIDPVGTSDGKYTIGRVGYVDGDKTTGLVECVWTEPNPDPSLPPLEMEIVCEVHKEPQGWRISGMAVKMAGNEEAFVLDFEDPASLQAALGGGTPPAQQPANVAQAPTGPGDQVSGAQPPAQLTSAPAPGQVPAQFQAQPGVQPNGQPGQFPPGPSQFPAAPADGQAPTQIAFPPTPSVNR